MEFKIILYLTDKKLSTFVCATWSKIAPKLANFLANFLDIAYFRVCAKCISVWRTGVSLIPDTVVRERTFSVRHLQSLEISSPHQSGCLLPAAVHGIWSLSSATTTTAHSH